MCWCRPWATCCGRPCRPRAECPGDGRVRLHLPGEGRQLGASDPVERPGVGARALGYVGVPRTGGRRMPAAWDRPSCADRDAFAGHGSVAPRRTPLSRRLGFPPRDAADGPGVGRRAWNQRAVRPRPGLRPRRCGAAPRPGDGDRCRDRRPGPGRPDEGPRTRRAARGRPAHCVRRSAEWAGAVRCPRRNPAGRSPWSGRSLRS